MTTNFSVTDAAVQSYVTDGGVQVTRYRRNGSAVLQAVIAAGGSVYDGIAPVPTSIPVYFGQTAILGVAESQRSGNVSKQTSSRDVESMSLLVKAHGEVERTTDQALRAQLHGTGATGFGARLVAQKSPAIYGGFDRDHLRAIATQASVTDVEWVASAPIATLSSALATYDETAYNADAIIVTRRGARQMGLAVDGEGRLQFNGPLASALPLDIPVFQTDATASDINVSNILAIIGPFASCAVGMAGETIIKEFDQLEPTGGGAQENIMSYLVERYLGFAKPPTTIIPQGGWTIITDDA
jgi:hypothetical protein